MNQLSALNSEELAGFTFKRGDSRLAEMLFRYRARKLRRNLKEQRD